MGGSIFFSALRESLPPSKGEQNGDVRNVKHRQKPRKNANSFLLRKYFSHNIYF